MSDTDKDGLSDFDERWRGSDPTKPDSDGDGMTDGDEVDLGWDPTKPEPERVRDHRAEMDRKWEDLDRSYEEARDLFRDSDYDGIDNHTERKLGLDPYNRDTDGDTLDDGLEISLGLDPKDNLPDAPEPAPHVPMRLDEPFVAAAAPSTTPPPIEPEPLFETTAAEPFTTTESYATDGFQSDMVAELDEGGASYTDGGFEV